MASQALVGWVCSFIVLGLLVAYVSLELVKRWRVNLRLTGLDEGLLDDEGISVEVITDAPKGSMVDSRVPVIPLQDEG
ncbi:MAG TPA: hypothetical protein DGN59_08255 [Candidatus Latescibacteria bacterium]|nr:hypothetical protein [Candidatus Latescibacterota bacterium]|tara:strand:+ start:132 stop:365 length:234 start_codon:yes stop_codon:yes gene_type:complete